MDSAEAQLLLDLEPERELSGLSAPDRGEAPLPPSHSRSHQSISADASQNAHIRRLARSLGPGAMVAARVQGREVAVARLGSGRLVVVADACPHDGGRISDGFVDGERLVCTRHGWELEVRRGRCERVCKLRE